MDRTPEIRVFLGSTSDWVLVVAGIHPTEQSGIEIAHWIGARLEQRAQKNKRTGLGVIVIPDLFFEHSSALRTVEWRDFAAKKKQWEGSNDQRMIDGVQAARMFPQPGKSLDSLGLSKKVTVDGKSTAMLPQIEFLIRMIELFQPIRIVTIHGKRARTGDDLRHAAGLATADDKKRNLKPPAKVIDMTERQIQDWKGDTGIKGVNFQGVFVDPRYQPGKDCMARDEGPFYLEACKFLPDLDPAFPLKGDPKSKRVDSARTDRYRVDDLLAVAAAQAINAIKSDAHLVEGNHLDPKDAPPVVHYAKEGGTPKGYSLGDWGPVDVGSTSGQPGFRLGAPVFTIETKANHESWSFLDGVQVVDENGEPMEKPLTVQERAAGKKNAGKYAKPEYYNSGRSKELQAYADGIIKILLEPGMSGPQAK